MTLTTGISVMSGDYRVPILLVDEETGLMDQLDQGWSMEDFYSLCSIFRLHPVRLLDTIEKKVFCHISDKRPTPSSDYYVRIDVGAYRDFEREG